MTDNQDKKRPARFFDCNAYLGLPAIRQQCPVFTVEEFVASMENAGVERALVFHIMQHDEAAVPGNDALAEAIAAHPNFFGCWAILPDADWEMPAAQVFFQKMKAARVRAVRAFPLRYGYFLDGLYCKNILGAIEERRIPLLLSVRRGADYATLYENLKRDESSHPGPTTVGQDILLSGGVIGDLRKRRTP